MLLLSQQYLKLIISVNFFNQFQKFLFILLFIGDPFSVIKQSISRAWSGSLLCLLFGNAQQICSVSIWSFVTRIYSLNFHHHFYFIIYHFCGLYNKIIDTSCIDPCRLRSLFYFQVVAFNGIVVEYIFIVIEEISDYL